jgi:hypothetical protein
MSVVAALIFAGFGAAVLLTRDSIFGLPLESSWWKQGIALIAVAAVVFGLGLLASWALPWA